MTRRTSICMQRSSWHVKLTESYRSIAIVSVFLLILLLFRSTQTVNKSGRQTPHSLLADGLGWVWANSINTLISVTNVNIESQKHLCVWKVWALQKADLENKRLLRVQARICLRDFDLCLPWKQHKQKRVFKIQCKEWLRCISNVWPCSTLQYFLSLYSFKIQWSTIGIHLYIQSFPLSLCGPNSISRANAHMVYGLKH